MLSFFLELYALVSSELFGSSSSTLNFKVAALLSCFLSCFWWVSMEMVLDSLLSVSSSAAIDFDFDLGFLNLRTWKLGADFSKEMGD